MARYEVRIIGKTGPRNIEVTATDIKEVQRIASRQGRFVTAKKKRGFNIVPGMTANERYSWMIRMSSMIGSKPEEPNPWLDSLMMKKAGRAMFWSKSSLSKVSEWLTN